MKCEHFDNKKLFHETLFAEGPRGVSKQEIKEHLRKYYGEDLLAYALQENMAGEFLMTQIAELFNRKLIKPRNVGEYDIKGKEVMPCLDFMVHRGFMSEEGKENLIEGLKNTEKVKRLLAEEE